MRWLLLVMAAAGCASRQQREAEPRSDLTAQGTPIRLDGTHVPESRRTTAPEPADIRAPTEIVVEPDEPTPPPGAPVVRLLDAGGSPRRKLRYVVPAPRKTIAVMEMTMTMDLTLGAAPGRNVVSPPIRTTMEFDIAPTSAPAELTLAFKLTGAEVLPGPGADILRPQIARMVGMSGAGRVTTRGLVLAMDHRVPPDLPPAMTSTLDSMRNSIRQMSVPLPAEAVGPGARWEVEQTVEMGGLSFTQVVQHSLREMTDGRTTIAVTLQQSAPRQEMKLPGVAPGTVATLESMRGGGSGEFELDLAAVVPRSGRMTHESDMATRMTVGGQAMDMRMKVRTEASFQQNR